MNNKGEISGFSNYGNTVHIAAPGENIITTAPEGGYDMVSGTSMSAAFISGVASLIQSFMPESTPNDIAFRIKNTVVKSAEFKGKIITGGYLDAFAALKATDTAPNEVGDLPEDNEGSNSESIYSTLAVQVADDLKSQIHYGEEGVNAASGNYSYSATDMSVEAPGFVVNISRSYNSKDDRNSYLGRGWTFGFEGSAKTCEYKSNWKQVKLPTGEVQMFTDNGNGTYTANDSRNKLERLGDNTFKLTTKDLYTYEFNVYGYLYKNHITWIVMVTINMEKSQQSQTEMEIQRYTKEIHAAI
jgi:hypothetical protein